MSFHTPVLLSEVLDALQIKSGGRYIDCTLGGGGHTQAILQAGGQVLGIDQDPEAINHAISVLDNPTHFRALEGNFANLTELARANEYMSVHGILLDLGVSSHQFDTRERGFSFQTNAPLDMRMSPHLGVTAADLINALGVKELIKLFTTYGNETKAVKIAHAVVAARKIKPFATTQQLAQLIEQVHQHRLGHLHPATKVFQALRVAVNDEINNLKLVLPQAVNLLAPKGRLVVISFHQGEDKVVKDFFRHNQHLTTITHKPITPSSQEVADNPRSRSSKLRIAEKK